MTLRQTQIIEWSTTPRELRRIAEKMELEQSAWNIVDDTLIRVSGVELRIVFDLGQWQAEQVEDNE